MSRIEKLQIQGFRSFSPDEKNPGPQKIDFIRKFQGSVHGISSPLTLILGQNGCGKTTIIECLRYVTTGDFPPGSYSGRNFVHDPKMYGEVTVYANVKLQFVGNDNKRYIISRSIEATQKPKQVSIKTLDSTLTCQGPDGKKVSLSSKCADINAEMLRRMGVTQPILNYVIFCHQEDSNWPLDEGSKVKQKFDDIFAAAKYNDLLKHIKDTRAGILAKIKFDQKDLEIDADNMKIAKEKKKDLKAKVKCKEDIEATIEGLKEQLLPLEEELKKITDVERNFSGIYEKLTKAETSIAHYKNEIKELKRHLGANEMSDKSLEDLERLKEQMADEERKLDKNKSELSQELKQIRAQADRSRNQIDKVQTQLDECKTLQKVHLANRKALKSELEKIGRHLDWDVSNKAMFEDRNVKEAIENIDATRAHYEEEKMAEQRKFEAELESQQEEIGKLEVKQAQVEQQKDSLMKSRTDRKRELAIIRRQITELDGFSTKLDQLKRQLEDKDKQLEKVQKSLDPVQVDRDIKEKSATVQALDKEVKSLRNEMSSLSNLREISSQLNLKKGDFEAKSKNLDKINSKCYGDLETLFKHAVPKPELLKKEFSKVDSETAQQKVQLEQKRMQLRSKIERENEDNSRISNEINSGDLRIKQFEQNLNSIDTFDAALEAAKANVEKIREDLQVREANKHTFKQFIEKLEKSGKPTCPTCSRGFDSAEDCREVIDSLKGEIERVPEKVKIYQSRLNDALKRLDELEKMLPEKTTCQEIRNDLEAKREKLERGQRSVIDMKAEYSRIEAELLNIDELVHACNNIREHVLTMDNLNKEVTTLKASILELESKLEKQGLSRSYEDVKAEEELKSQDLDRFRDGLEELRSKKVDYDAQINRLQSERNSLFNSKLQLEKQQQDRSNMEEKKTSLEAQIAIDDTLVDELIQQLKPLNGKIINAKDSKEATNQEKNAVMQKLAAKIDQIRDMQKDIENMYNNVDKYEKSQNEQTLVECERELAKKRRELEEIKANNDALAENLLKIDKTLNSQELRKRHLEDNIKLNKHLSDEQRYQDQVKGLKTQLKSLDYETFKEKKKIIVEQIEQLEREISTKNGRLAGFLDQIKDLENELDQDRLKLAPQKYREKLVEKLAKEKAAKDLNNYFTALDWAIMRFHKERMKVINRIMKELWRATYKGNDIDYIEIKTDDVDVTQGADRRRNYNYRVVMVKNDTELEMRGRCSAGQKVLASLIIRLALAETFSANCGMIALDEPTTNLDRDNIESLAHALSDLVVSRANSNFQLIVITHDEDLLDFLGRVDQVDHYYKVSRDEHGHSIIRKNLMNDRR